MGFSEELEKIQNKKKEFKTRISWLSTDKQNLIDSIIAEINDKYKEKEITLNEKVKKCNEDIQIQYKKIEDYSTFNEYEISKVFRDLITIFEGEEYIYQSDVSCFSERNYRYHNNPNIIIVNNESDNFLRYSKEELDFLVKKGKALIVNQNSSKRDNPKIKFYELNKKGDLKQLFHFKKFSYLRDYLNIVIAYKIDNKLENISKEELYKLMIQFINLHLSEIEENYKKREAEERQEMETIIEDNNKERVKKLTRILKKDNSTL